MDELRMSIVNSIIFKPGIIISVVFFTIALILYGIYKLGYVEKCKVHSKNFLFSGIVIAMLLVVMKVCLIVTAI
ncbi:MAG: hypothetical protein ACRC45_05170 [Cetobacterium sp.]